MGTMATNLYGASPSLSVLMSVRLVQRCVKHGKNGVRMARYSQKQSEQGGTNERGIDAGA